MIGADSNAADEMVAKIAKDQLGLDWRKDIQEERIFLLVPGDSSLRHVKSKFTSRGIPSKWRHSSKHQVENAQDRIAALLDKGKTLIQAVVTLNKSRPVSPTNGFGLAPVGAFDGDYCLPSPAIDDVACDPHQERVTLDGAHGFLKEFAARHGLVLALTAFQIAIRMNGVWCIAPHLHIAFVTEGRIHDTQALELFDSLEKFLLSETSIGPRFPFIRVSAQRSSCVIRTNGHAAAWATYVYAYPIKFYATAGEELNASDHVEWRINKWGGIPKLSVKEFAEVLRAFVSSPSALGRSGRPKKAGRFAQTVRTFGPLSGRTETLPKSHDDDYSEGDDTTSAAQEASDFVDEAPASIGCADNVCEDSGEKNERGNLSIASPEVPTASSPARQIFRVLCWLVRPCPALKRDVVTAVVQHPPTQDTRKLLGMLAATRRHAANATLALIAHQEILKKRDMEEHAAA